jgi:hypothetical protein
MEKETTRKRIEKALAPVQETAAAVMDMDDSWAEETINTEDIVLPRILLMQALSPLVAEKEMAEPGDIVKSTTEEVVAAKGSLLRIVPITSFKTWRKEKKVDGKWKFYDQEDYTPATANRGWEEFEDMDPKTNKKETFKWVRCFNFYVNLKSDLEAAVKGESAALPCLVSFKSTSFDTGKKIYSGIAEGMTMKSPKNPKGLPAFSREYSLSSKKTVGDKGTFYTFEVIQGKLIPDEERAIANKWYSTVKKSSVKVHEASDDT